MTKTIAAQLIDERARLAREIDRKAPGYAIAETKRRIADLETRYAATRRRY